MSDLRLRDQLELIEGTDWDILCILDACRADYYREETGRGETVLSPASHTCNWVEAIAPWLRKQHYVYISANPAVSKCNQQRGLRLMIQSLALNHWAPWGPDRLATVHPITTSAVALERWADEANWHYGTPLRFIVHYTQPHLPYIGEVGLTEAGIPRGPRGGLTEIRELADQHCLNFQVLQECYRANLRLALKAVDYLVCCANARVIVTADHGEALGEDDGRVMHNVCWMDPDTHPEARAVPWDVREPAGPLPSDLEKLNALGYV